LSAERITLHGHDVHYRREGWGPPILLIHGVTGSSATWEDVIPFLSERHTVIAPDLLGHGDSAKPRGDYSLGAYASGIRDLMRAIGHDRATVVGHSLGGGVAMQLAYQFPEMCERLVLVSSGGLGREVSIFLRAATLPGSEWVLPLLASNGVLSAGGRVGNVLRSVGLRAGPDLQEMWKGFSSLGDSEARQAFIYTLRGIVDPGGQRVSARDRLYLAKTVPTMLIWGERDPIIPVVHGYSTHEQIPHSRLEVIDGAGHFPYRDDPRRFAGLLSEFVDETEPAEADWDELRELLRGGE
jgi:pimeloyl-ACP methyl ester carboxylesterase